MALIFPLYKQMRFSKQGIQDIRILSNLAGLSRGLGSEMNVYHYGLQSCQESSVTQFY